MKQAYTGWPQILAHFFVRLNFIRLKFIKYWPIFKYFTLYIRRTFVIRLSLKMLTHLKWNVSFLKATIENKTTSVTTHFKIGNNRKQRVYCFSYYLK